jgi:hypothetical protein
MKLSGGNLRLWLGLALLLSGASAFAYGNPSPIVGDEDPFPLMCTNFSGDWKSDCGDHTVIQQRECSFLKMQTNKGSDTEVFDIIPDNKTRADRGSEVRNRWNSPDNATVLETHRVFMKDIGTRITVETTFERASEGMLLETTYTTVEHLNQPNMPPQHEYNQVIFRKVGLQ